VGAYIVSSVVVLLVGLSGAFDRIINRLPAAIAAGMLAGILFRFGTGLFVSVREQPWLVLAMFGTYLLFKRALPRYAVLAVL
ncbi:benzoate/H(+) symporter BenE family transporter, partial [Escherichia coli]|uniref:benzoate/H(+) symporter BenE family transporter n=2 Tax=Gammaproteobacteria TaxID=1236 RepID=UPI0028DF4A75